MMSQEREAQTVPAPELIAKAQQRERHIDLTGEIVNRIAALNLEQLEALDEALTIIEQAGARP